MTNSGAASVPGLDVDQALDWIRLLHRDTGGYVGVNSAGLADDTRTDWPGRFYALTEPGADDAIAEYLDQRDTIGATGIYLGQVSVVVRPKAGARTKVDQAHKLASLWADGDTASPAHKHITCPGGADCEHEGRPHRAVRWPLPPDAAAMWAIVEEAGYDPPSVTQDTGNGVYAHWLLDEPQVCTGGKAGPQGQLSDRLHQQLKHAAARLKLHYGPLGDLARVLRLPGTLNRKPGTPGGVALSRLTAVTDRRYTWAQMVAMVEAAEERTRRAEPRKPAPAVVPPRGVGIPGSPDPDRPRLVQANSPIDDFNARADWMRDVMSPAGWQLAMRVGQELRITRPGKDVTAGWSATINGTGADTLHVFSSDAAPFEPDENYTKAGAWREIHHGGADGDPSWSATNRDLRARGYGDPLPAREWQPPEPVEMVEPDMDTLTPPDGDLWGSEPQDTGAGLTPDEQAEAARLLAVQQRAAKIREKAEEERIRRAARRLVDAEDMAELQATRRLRLVDGWEFLQEDPEQEEQAIWGNGPQWLWAPGEPIMLFGGNGVYKSTLSHLLVFARLGLLGPGGTARTDHRVITDEDHPDEWGRVLGMPVRPMAHGTTLIYLAGDRPRQIRRAMRRHRRDWMREILAERLIIHEGPLPFELTTNKDGLADLAMERKGSDIFVDSLKDYCPKPSEDESANGYNRARQECIARGMQWVEDHHNRKIAQGQTRTNGIEDVYGSRWLTAGAGSVVSMWCDEEGSAAVHVKQVKSPGEFVPELEVTVDKTAGTMGAAVRQDPISFIRSAGAQGVTAAEYATFTGLAANAARNQLNTRERQGVLERVPKGPTEKADRYRVKVGVLPQTVQNARQVDGLPW